MRNDVRACIFNRLRAEDPGFAAHFRALVTELLSYHGWYFDGTEVSVRVADQPALFSHWLVNGRRRDGARLVVEVSEHTSIRAVMR